MPDQRPDNLVPEDEDEILIKQYPSLPLAYDIAISSYDGAQRAMDAIDGRLQTMITFIATSTTGVVAIASARSMTFHSTWFFVAIVLAGISLLLGLIARYFGRLKVLDPKNLYEQNWLADSTAVFQKDLIFYAGEAFEHNTEIIHKKWLSSMIMGFIFVLEAICLVSWLTAAASRS